GGPRGAAARAAAPPSRCRLGRDAGGVPRHDDRGGAAPLPLLPGPQSPLPSRALPGPGAFLLRPALARADAVRRRRQGGRPSFALWYLMAMEESSTALARDMGRRPVTETLGPLEPTFAAVHRDHMRDE